MSEPERPTKTVLVADDEAGVRALVRIALESDDVNVLEAGDGQVALEIARSECPDLIILDVAMPEIDGFEVCRAIKSDPTTRGCHVVMLTAMARRQDHEEGIAAGADDYLTKPFSPRALTELAERVLSVASE